MEVWKVIKNHPDYDISDFGRVRSRKRKNTAILKPMPRAGYLRVELDCKCYSIHRLVAESFISVIENKTRVNHINGIKTDNHVSNLEWCTDSENIRHAINTGLKLSSKGERNGQSKLKEHQIIEIRNSDLSHRKLGLIYGVDKSIIGDVKNFKTWKHI